MGVRDACSLDSEAVREMSCCYAWSEGEFASSIIFVAWKTRETALECSDQLPEHSVYLFAFPHLLPHDYFVRSSSLLLPGRSLCPKEKGRKHPPTA
jgi:hypothetical protein